MENLRIDTIQNQKMIFQWHITERCNLRCNHCYQGSYNRDELSYTGLLDIFGQFRELLKYRNQNQGHITVTGGEPFIRRDFFDLLYLFNANRDTFSYGILTNGHYIDRGVAAELKKLKVGFVQVSIDGSQPTHDRIRGEGSYDRAVAAIKHLVSARVRTLISFTAHQSNYHEFADVAALGRKLRVDKVWTDRLIPEGSAEAMGGQVLSPEETGQFLEVISAEKQKRSINPFNKTTIAADRALQFISGGGRPYHCTAGDSLVTIQPDGELSPCRRMPINVGNLTRTPLTELYRGSPLFKALRDKDTISAGCEDCFYNKLCRGGLKCLSHAVYGDPFRADPGCRLAQRF